MRAQRHIFILAFPRGPLRSNSALLGSRKQTSVPLGAVSQWDGPLLTSDGPVINCGMSDRGAISPAGSMAVVLALSGGDGKRSSVPQQDRKWHCVHLSPAAHYRAPSTATEIKLAHYSLCNQRPLYCHAGPAEEPHRVKAPFPVFSSHTGVMISYLVFTLQNTLQVKHQDQIGSLHALLLVTAYMWELSIASVYRSLWHKVAWILLCHHGLFPCQLWYHNSSFFLLFFFKDGCFSISNKNLK